MIIINGRYNEAKCFATTLDDSAREQIRVMCDTEAYRDTVIRIMPDVHAGKGCTIGTTMRITDKVSPSMVGVDIGCGMYTVALGKADIDFKRLDRAAHYIPSGMQVWEDESVTYDLLGLRCYDRLHSHDRLERSLGTLGGGNHFIEVDEDDAGERYLVIHSGSRNLGHQVASYYQHIATEGLHGDGEYDTRRKEMIATYKAEGRKRELREALLALEQEYKQRRASVPRDLCYLSGDMLDDYLHDLAICQRFADDSRRRMAEIILGECSLEARDSFTTIHNYIDLDARVLRKGAVSAKKGEKLLIPINMRDGSLICIGKGNADWNYSAPHGAGRLMSRSVALERLTMEEYERSMRGIYTTTVSRETLDESPMAYKSIDEIVANIEPTAEIINRIRPIYNFKAAES